MSGDEIKPGVMVVKMHVFDGPALRVVEHVAPSVVRLSDDSREHVWNLVVVRCSHVRVDHVVPGWACCSCATYNGYQRDACRQCGHTPCYDREGERGREAAELRVIGSSSDLVRAWMVRQRKVSS